MTLVVWYRDGSQGIVWGVDAQAAARIAWRSGDVIAVFPGEVPA